MNREKRVKTQARGISGNPTGLVSPPGLEREIERRAIGEWETQPLPVKLTDS